ncbi:ATPase [Bacillus sp. JJ1562]|uniref:ATPase n=1 Tax=Bacillus sp. JJ1562 TaxID=3122960 RepID=UPI00300345F1
MKKISLIASIGSMVLLYLIGFIANIDILVFKFTPSHTEIALLPIAVGLLIAIICDGLNKYKSKKHDHLQK